jgi:uncharacterized protein YgbK (DUF1537 family)
MSLSKTIVLDDDPTGTQTVHDIAVLTVWDVSTLARELQQPESLFFILTNTRAMPEQQARDLMLEICGNLKQASAQTGVGFTLISRGDSTLRGHFPTEPEAIEQGLGVRFDAWFLIPFFEEGGRITRNDIHYVREGERMIPAAETPFAQDATFGFRHSDLKEYVAEKTRGRIPAQAVASISLDELRNPDQEPLKLRLAGFSNGQVVVVNAETMRDLEPLAEIIETLPNKQFLFRTAASWVKAMHRPSGPPTPLNPKGKAGGLIVVGSYVPKTTEQLTALLDQNDCLTAIELPIGDILAPGSGAFAEQVSQQINALITNGQHVVVYTGRTLIRDDDPVRSLEIGNRVSAFLVGLVQSLQTAPRFLIAKGGITSSDTATQGLGIRRAMVRGQLLPGVPVWEAGPESRFPGLMYVVFPGNVGDKMALRTAFNKLTDQ